MGWRGTALQLDESERFTRREWAVTRVAWGMLAALVVAALLGVFSNGPVSHTVAASESGDLVVGYQRFVRQLGTTSLNLSARPDPGAATVTLVVSPEYLAKNEVEQVVPEPSSVRATGRGVEYQFQVADLGAAEVDVDVTFHVQPDDIGVQHFAVALDGDVPVRFWQLMYP